MSPRLRIDNRDNVYKDMKSYDPIEPQNLYSQTHSILEINKCQRRKVIKNFCFPDDVRLAQVNDFEQVNQYVLQQHCNSDCDKVYDEERKEWREDSAMVNDV